MHSANVPETMRRSSRVPITLPIAVTSLEPSAPFSEICETLVVSAHGCAIFSPTRLEAGIPVQFRRKGGGAAKAHVVDCKPMGAGQHGLAAGSEARPARKFLGTGSRVPKIGGGCSKFILTIPQPPRKMPRSDKSPTRRARTQDRFRKGPCASDRARSCAPSWPSLFSPCMRKWWRSRKRLAQGDAKRSRFDISLSHIPPEVEEKLWVRLREDLGTQVLKQTQEQSAQVLGSAKTMIEQKIVQALEGFRQQVAQQLQTVQQNAQRVVRRDRRGGRPALQFRSGEISAAGGGCGSPGAAAKRRTLPLAAATAGRGARCLPAGDAEGCRTRSQPKSRGCRRKLTSLGSRIAQLDDTACRLESGMETRLSQMASDQISAARVQLETAVDVVLKELGTRNAKELDRQLDEARGKLKIVQKGIETSVTDLVKTEVAASLLSFGQTMEELAQDSVGRWRSALSKDLTSVAKILGGGFQRETASSRGAKDSSDE